MQSEDRIVSLSFDRFPARKGAAVHIAAFASALGQRFGNVDLVTVASAPDADRREDVEWSVLGVTHHPLPADGASLFDRVLCFRSHVWNWWKQRWGQHGKRPRVAHFRSIFEGYPIAYDKSAFCEQLVYEVNGLPSVELKYHYSAVADDHELLAKLREQERVCLAAADRIITVSEVNARYLVSRGVPRQKITVIPNGVHTDAFRYEPPRPWWNSDGSAREIRIIYSGTMSSWQGVTQALEALSLIVRDHPARLQLVGPARSREKKVIAELARKLRIADHIELCEAVGLPELVAYHHAADVVLAPLTRNDRNCEQGCCPLKVLEALASGTPLIASDLEVVRELCTTDLHALLVRPGSAKSIKDAILRLRDEPELGPRLSVAGRAHVVSQFDWSHATARLIALYNDVLSHSE